jgi:hypothetical protein
MATKFEYRKSLVTKDEPTLLYFIINNSETITRGDAVNIDANGHAEPADATEKVMGIVAHVVDKNGIKVAPDSGTLDNYTVASDNETSAQKKVGIIVSKYALFYNDSDDTLATTNLGQFFDLITEYQIDASSASDTSGTFQLMELDPDGDADASKGLFRIAESQMDHYAQQ